jgi:phage N-6-adenine-methyltransferase
VSQHDRHKTATDEPGELLWGPDGYPITEKMRWRTDPAIFQAIDREFHFDLDACAEDVCALAPRWLTHQEDCLKADWLTTFREGSPSTLTRVSVEDSPIRSAFINPPWSARFVPEWVKKKYPDRKISPFPGTHLFVERAYQMSRRGLTVAALLPQSFDSVWMKPFLVRADEVRVGGRFRFTTTSGEVGAQPPGGHALLVFRPHVPADGWPGGPRVNWQWEPT